MVVDLKEHQPTGMMPGGVIFTMSWKRLIEQLRKTNEIGEFEDVTHISSDLTGITFRVEHR